MLMACCVLVVKENDEQFKFMLRNKNSNAEFLVSVHEQVHSLCHLFTICNSKRCVDNKLVQEICCLKKCHVSLVVAKQLVSDVSTNICVFKKRDFAKESVERCHTVVC